MIIHFRCILKFISKGYEYRLCHISQGFYEFTPTNRGSNLGQWGCFFAWYKERKNCSETPLEYIIEFLVLILGANHSPLFRVFMTVYNGDGNINIYCHFEFWF